MIPLILVDSRKLGHPTVIATRGIRVVANVVDDACMRHLRDASNFLYVHSGTAMS